MDWKRTLVFLFLTCFVFSASSPAFAETTESVYLVLLEDGVSQNLVANYGTIEYNFQVINAVAVRMTETNAQELAAQPFVKSVEENQIVQIGPAATEKEQPPATEPLTILNPQSYPLRGENWIVNFETQGTADLTVEAINETTWSNENEENDLKFLEIVCNGEQKETQWADNKVTVQDYSCEEKSSLANKVLTEGIHDLKFTFGNTTQYAHNDAANYLWNLDEDGIKAIQAWNDYSVDGTGVKIAIIDSGVNYNLADLGGAKYLGGWDFCPTRPDYFCVGDDDDPMDEYGHGTEMASSILSAVGTIEGAAPNAQYYAIKVGNDDSHSDVLAILKAVEWAILQGDVDIIYMGVKSAGYGGLGLMMESGYEKGISYVAPSHTYPFGYPAGYYMVAAVGSHSKEIPQQVVFGFDLTTEILGPGEEVLVLDLNGNAVFADDNVGVAAAQVAGALALMVDYNKANGLDYNNSQLRDFLNEAAIPLGTGDPREGNGKADVHGAIGLMIGAPPVCSANADCGTDGFVDSPVCTASDVFQMYREYTCTNPGTAEASCSYTDTLTLKEDCGETENGEWGLPYCDANSSVRDRAVYNRGCSAGACTLEETTETEVIEECAYGCSEGTCITPACSADTDCGTSGFIEGLFCQEGDVFQNYITYTCLEPGTASAECTSETEPVQQEDCGETSYEPWSENQCSGNDVIRTRAVHEKDCDLGACYANETTETETIQTCEYGCSEGTCIIPACFTNAECGTDGFVEGLFCQEGNVFQNYITYTCNNAGTAQAYCSSAITAEQQEDCGETSYEPWSENQCSAEGNVIQTRAVHNKGCELGACYANDTTETMTIQTCENGCEAGQCITPMCTADTDCGIDGFVGNPFCQDDSLFQNYATHTCQNPGTPNAECHTETTPQMKENCGDTSHGQWTENTCQEGNVVKTRPIYERGCSIDTCYMNETTQTIIIEECENGCDNGTCITNIACTTDADCGTDGFVDNLFCQDDSVFQNYATHTCQNPGTPNAECHTETTPQMKENCGDTSHGQWTENTCQEGNVVKTRPIYERGCSIDTCYMNETTQTIIIEQCNYGCSEGACIVNIACLADADCGTNGFIDGLFCQEGDVFQNYITYACNNAGTEHAYCSSSTEEMLKETCEFGCDNGACNPNSNLFELNCPTGAVGQDYVFTWASPQGIKKMFLQAGTTQEFAAGTSYKTRVEGTQSAVEGYFKRLVNLEKKAENGVLYARLYALTQSGSWLYSNTCSFALEQPEQPALQCPTEPINESYAFAWSEGGLTGKATLRFSYNQEFQPKTSMNDETSPTPITEKYKTLINYEKKSTDEKLYAKITGKDQFGRALESNVCEFTLEQPEQPALQCPTEPINESYTFAWSEGDLTGKATLRFSYNQEFKPKTSIKDETSPTPITEKYKTLVKYEEKSVDEKLYAKITGKDQFGRALESNVCEFTLEQPVVQALQCPTAPVNANYAFAWNAGGYANNAQMQFSYENCFEKMVKISDSESPTPIAPKYKTLEKYQAQSSSGKLYARLFGKDNFGRQSYSNACEFELS